MDRQKSTKKSHTITVEIANTFTNSVLTQAADTSKAESHAEYALLDKSLGNLIQMLSDTLYPVEPSTVFVDGLKHRLVTGQASTTGTENSSQLVAQGQWIRPVFSVFTIIGVSTRIIAGFVVLRAILRKRRRQAYPV